jgi:hypothetical protein
MPKIGELDECLAPTANMCASPPLGHGGDGTRARVFCHRLNGHVLQRFRAIAFFLASHADPWPLLFSLVETASTQGESVRC